ncbi:MAG: hypothetical protein ACYTGC_16140, partial [Planctomycetota bacterium]
NSTDFGGGIAIQDGPTIVVNCRFSGNTADNSGGGILSVDADPMLVNCVFVGNSTDGYGGGMFNDGGYPVITNCTMIGNTADWEGGGLRSYHGDCNISNSIFWDNGDGIVDSSGSDSTVIRSDVQGGWSGLGHDNMDADPLCVDPAGGDMRLSSASPCVDAGDSTLLPEDALDLDADGDITEPLPVDLIWRTRVLDHPAAPDTGVPDTSGLVVDMGAWEFQPCPADTNGDGAVDADDLVNLILDWDTNGSGHGGDVDGNGTVGSDDLVELILAWGQC